MQCTACEHPNVEDARFCGACGASMSRPTTCLGCGRGNGDAQRRDELEARIAETLDLIQQCDMVGMLPLVLLERAGLARLRGDSDGMACDLLEARRLFAQMGATGWGDYARSIEA
jgi:hypothetical protein